VKVQNEAILQILNDAIPESMPSTRVTLVVTAQEVTALNINTPQVFTFTAIQVINSNNDDTTDVIIIDQPIDYDVVDDIIDNPVTPTTPTTTTKGSISTGKIALALVALAILYKVTKNKKK